MAKARSRTAARKLKDKWKSKNWYTIQAPASFDNVTIADTLADSPDNLINRVTEVSLQDLTNDFRKSHLKLFFKINKIEDTIAHTQFTGHTLTSDYLRRLIRRRRSKIDGVYDVNTRDGAILRVKPFATTDKRVQNSQKKVIREAMKKTIEDQAKISTLSEFVKNTIDGKTGSEIYKNCKKLYPVKRIEIYKTEVIEQPSIMIEDKKPKKTETPEETTGEVKEPEFKEDKTDGKIEEPKEVKEEKEELVKTEKKSKPKKTTAKKPAAKKTAAKKTTKAKSTTKKKTTTTKKKTAKKEK